MKVFFDHQAFANQRVGGVSRVFREIIEGLALEQPDWSISLFAAMHRSTLLPELKKSGLPNLGIYPSVKRPNGALGFGKVSRQINPRLLRRLTAHVRPEVFYPTWYDRRCEIWPDGRTGTVVVVHDMIHEKLPQFFPGRAQIASAKRHFISRADVIVTVSDNTRTDLLELQPDLDPDRVIVAPLATRFRRPDPLAPPERPFLLYVGKRNEYKNFPRLAEAFARSKRLKSEFQLICFGGAPVNRTEWQTLRSLDLGSGDVSFVSGDDATLARHYAQASAFIYPSLYEGFGIPILEAMACQTPIIASRAGSIPEVAGDAAVFFDPENTEDLQASIERVVFDPQLRSTLVKAGIRREKEFSWKSCAQRHRDACLMAAPSPPRRAGHHAKRARTARALSAVELTS